MIIKKRDGHSQFFQKQKIIDAVILSGASEETAEYIADYVKQALIPEMTVFEIERLVEESLINLGEAEAAREYISFRAKRATERQLTTDLFRSVLGVLAQKNPDVTTENANIDGKTLAASRHILAGELSKALAEQSLPEDILEAHRSGAIHFHDMNFWGNSWTNCCLVDLTNMLKGFTLGGAYIESPKSINTAASVIGQILANVSSNQYGGTSLPNIDKILEPYGFLSYEKHLKTAKAYDIALPEAYARDLTIMEIGSACQALEYECNSAHNNAAQSPFTTVSFGTTTSWVGREIQRALLNVRIKGLGKDGITAIFPKLIFFHDPEINGLPGSPNYDIKQLALKCSAKRMYPDWVSVKNNLEITGSSKPVTPMGCRSFLSVHKDQNGQEILDGRNNLGVVTVNPVQCALKARGSDNPLETFWKELENVVNIAHKGLQARIASMENARAEKSPVLYQNGAFGLRLPKEELVLPHLIARGCSISLGYIGLHETYTALFGEGTSLEHQQEFYLQVTKYLRDKVDKWKTEEGVGYSLYATPSESLSHRLLKIDRKKYGEIPGVTDREYYTNSFHLDVRNKVDPFTKIDFEAPFHWVSSGGHISYVEFPDMRNNLKALEAVVDYAMDKLDYFGVNTPADICLSCHKEVEAKPTSKGYVCPLCGSTKVSAVRRICGYLGPINDRGVNPGKQQEFTLRVKHQN